jgi:murein DD-endopeptidase MepM/ murein hydrolase activator NlpD
VPRTRLRVLLLAVLVGLLAGVVRTAPADADSVTDRKAGVDQQIADLREQLEGASADLVAAAVALKLSQVRLADAQAALATAQQARAVAVDADEALAARLAYAEAELDKAERQMQTEQDSEAATRVSIGRLARETYVANGAGGLSIALQATSPEEFTERMAVAGVALRAQGGTIDRLAVLEADLRARSSKLDAIRGQIADLKQQSEVVVAQRRAAEATAAAAAATVSALVAQEQAQVAVIQTKVAAEQERLSGLEAEQAKLQAVLAARAVAAREAAARRRAAGKDWQPPHSSGFLSMAAPGGVTSPYGMRYHPILHIYRLHSGVDFGVPCGTPVHAAADGDLVSAGPAGGYGNRIVIDHGEVGGGDLATTYNHLSRIIRSGGSVHRGEVIALSGTTGLSTGCHLHFETLLDGHFVNPMQFL